MGLGWVDKVCIFNANFVLVYMKYFTDVECLTYVKHVGYIENVVLFLIRCIVLTFNSSKCR